MPVFVYKAKKGPGELTEGTIEAESLTAALSKLDQSGYYPLSVEEQRPLERSKRGWGFHRRGRVPLSELCIFTRQLANLLEAGQTLLDALTVLFEQTSHPVLQATIDEVRRQIQEGRPFSEALAQHPQIFSRLYVSMTRSGEVGGTLTQVLTSLADLFEKHEELRGKITTALAYPIFILSVGIIMVIVLLTFVFPRLMTVFIDLGQALPLPTRILLAVSRALTHYWWLVAAIVVILIGVLRRATRAKEGRLLLDQWRLRIPKVGSLIQKTEVARFARSLGALLGNGVPILQALDVATDVMGSEVFKRELAMIRQEVAQGSTLSSGTRKSRYFPLFVSNLIGVGEGTGGLDAALLKIAQAYDREVDRVVKVTTSILEPFLILVVGAVIGSIIIAILLPIFQLSMIAR